ncbi:MAG: M48 family metallopeptidase, partial [Spirochaetia bacterium]|nr:M48 family metallopeptidase [Spirochaetia bacterium]
MPESVKIVDIEKIGLVWIKKNKKSRYIRISVNPYEPVTVSVPQRVSIKDSIAVVKEKEAWIIQQLEKISCRYKKPGIFNESTQFKTYLHTFEIQKGKVQQCKASRKGFNLIITYPESLNVENNEVQGFIQSTITKIARSEAVKYLPERVFNLAKTHQFSYKKVFIKNTKSRWGSCSSENNINLNLHLVLLPQHLSDYVILHELVHTVEKNHGKQFWKKLGLITGDAKKL